MLPTSLEAATERMMRPDSIAREESVFGNDFVEHFGGTRQHEVRLWNEAVTNWEGGYFVVLRQDAKLIYPQLRGTLSWPRALDNAKYNYMYNTITAAQS